mmetsp:Transcript_39001/g.54183  ORF Transcript_39001/g.54183 Transcript_39001/m.54183 type:complete len:255 (+) Transcript_39001:295-1059(+)
MITTPGFTQLFFTMAGWPQHAIIMSALLTSSWMLVVLECTMVTVASRFSSSMAAGIPTMLDRPTTTACLPAICTPVRSSSSMQPLGVQGTNRGSRPFIESCPMFRGWNPSTSFSMLMAAKTVCSSMCLGSGSCTKIPCTLGSALKAFTTSSTCCCVAVSGRSLSKEAIPTSAHFFRFILTYVWESLRIPTMTTAKPGTFPVFSFIAEISTLISSVMIADISLPLITVAGSRLTPTKGMLEITAPIVPVIAPPIP